MCANASTAHDGSSTTAHMSLARAALITFIILVWYGISTTTILVTKGVFEYHFPFPLIVTTYSNTITTVWAFLFTRFERFRPKPLTAREFREYVLPIGVSTALEIGCSNVALQLLTVSFGTILKGGAPVFTMLWGILLRVENFSLRLFACLITIAAGIALASMGQHQSFDVLGFILQLTATALGGLRWALTHRLLQGSSYTKMPPLTATLYTSPMTALCVLPVAIFFEGKSFFNKLPTFESSDGVYDLAAMTFIATLVFMLLNCEYWLVNSTSSLALSVAGVFKELCTIAGGVVFFHDIITKLNVIGFIICQVGILFYVWLRYDSPSHSNGSGNTPEPEELPLAFREAEDDEEDDGFVDAKDGLRAT